MNYGEIFDCDVANGPGMRVSLFVSGCRHHCRGCFNEQTWDFSYGKEFTYGINLLILKKLQPSYIKGLTILGGEPFEPENQEKVLEIIEDVRFHYSNKSIWLYSGYTFEELQSSPKCHTEHTKKILSLADVLVDGEFILSKKNISLKFRGSENQRILDLKKSMKFERPIWMEEFR